MGDKKSDELIENRDITNIILPDFIDECSGKYFVFDMEWGIIDAFEEYRGKYQFIFYEIINDGKNSKYKMFLNGRKTRDRDLGWSDEDTDVYYALYNSVLMNHPLFGKKLKDLWGSDIACS